MIEQLAKQSKQNMKANLDMRREYRDLQKIVKKEGGVIVEIQKHDRMDKVKIDFGGNIISYNFSTSKHCNFQNMVRSQIKKLKRQAA